MVAMLKPVIRSAARTWWRVDVASLWSRRRMVVVLVWRELVVRYKQTVAGILWVVLQPAFEMLVFTLVFHHFVGIETDGLPYPVFVYLGLLPWTYFATTVNVVTTSVVGARNLLLRMAFPRVYLPVAAALSKLVDTLAAFVVLFGLMWYYAVPVNAAILWIIPLLGVTFLAALGTGLWLASLHVRYRDIGIIVPYALRMAMFLTPVIYPVSSVTSQWAWLLRINPLAGIIESFRSAVLTGQAVLTERLVEGVLIVFVVFFTGFFFFRSMEESFIDEL